MSLIDSIRERTSYFFETNPSENQEKAKAPAQENTSQATQHNRAILEKKKAEAGLQRNIQELSSIKKITADNFKETIKKGVTLVNFYTDWCRFCHKVTPELEKVAAELQGQASIVKLDFDQAKEIASTYRVRGVPTLILFRDGEEIGQLLGARDAQAIKDFMLSAKK